MRQKGRVWCDIKRLVNTPRISLTAFCRVCRYMDTTQAIMCLDKLHTSFFDFYADVEVSNDLFILERWFYPKYNLCWMWKKSSVVFKTALKKNKRKFAKHEINKGRVKNLRFVRTLMYSFFHITLSETPMLANHYATLHNFCHCYI